MNKEELEKLVERVRVRTRKRQTMTELQSKYIVLPKADYEENDGNVYVDFNILQGDVEITKIPRYCRLSVFSDKRLRKRNSNQINRSDK